MTETFDASEIKEFISGHITSSKWHLVVQFIAGLLGKKIRLFDGEQYKDCVAAFAESLVNFRVHIQVSCNNVFVMKCLREMGLDDKIAKEIYETTGMSNVTTLSAGLFYKPSLSDWVTVTFFANSWKIWQNSVYIACLQIVFRKSKNSYEEDA